MHSSAPGRAVPSAVLILLLIAGIFSTGCTVHDGSPAGRLQVVENRGDLRVYFLDVGQGDSSLILLNGTAILIDAGETDKGDIVVSDLRALGVDHIDLLVATHPHSDHIGGMQEVLAAFPVGTVLDTGLPSTSSVYEKFLRTLDLKNIPYVIAAQGQTIELDPALTVLVLSPSNKRLDGDLNANSIVLKVSYGNVSFLFTGDAGRDAELALIKTGYSPEATVLKVAHHGSSDATSPAFLSRVRPEVAIISLSADNPYGYPHSETLAVLAAAVPAVYRTDRDGNVLVQSDGVSYSVTTEKGQIPVPASTPARSVTVTSPGISSPSHSAAVTTPAIRAGTSDIKILALPMTSSNITIPIPSVSLPAVRIGNASTVKIGAVQFDAPGDDRDNLNGEWVRITNSGDGPVLVAGWTLSDKTGADPYTFPAYLLMAGASVTVCTGSGSMNDTVLFMGRTEPVWGNSGDIAVLKDGSGNVIDRQPGGSS